MLRIRVDPTFKKNPDPDPTLEKGPELDPTFEKKTESGSDLREKNGIWIRSSETKPS